MGLGEILTESTFDGLHFPEADFWLGITSRLPVTPS